MSLLLVPEDRRKDTCGQCEQVDDLPCLVSELKEEVDRQYYHGVQEGSRLLESHSSILETDSLDGRSAGAGRTPPLSQKKET